MQHVLADDASAELLSSIFEVVCSSSSGIEAARVAFDGPVDGNVDTKVGTATLMTGN